jgi:hypothetical protein
LVVEARANWGQVTVHVLELRQLAGVELSCNLRGFIFAMGCAADPNRPFTDGRQLTSAGREAARGQLQRLVRHYEPSAAIRWWWAAYG